MKRIILGLSLLLILLQNGLASNNSDVAWDQLIANQPDKVWKQIYRCQKEVSNKTTGNPQECTKVVELIHKNKYILGEGINEGGVRIDAFYTYAGFLYELSKHDLIKAYENYMKAARLGSPIAQKNLDILCKKHSWVCK